jgi:hypothetical protein
MCRHVGHRCCGRSGAPVRCGRAGGVSTQAGWLPVAPAIAAVLDQHAQRLRGQDAMIAARQATIRAVIDLARQAGQQEPPPR